MFDSAFEAHTLQLGELLTRAARRCLASARCPALLFSGGLDSSILAALLSALRPTATLLIVAGSGAARDVQAAGQVATSLGLPLEIRQFAVAEVAEALPTILAKIGCTDVLQVSLAIPLHFAASRAHELGVTVLFSGQGADELFGGYARYECAVLEDKTQAVNAAMRGDFEKLLKITLPYQEAVAGRHAIQLTAPYLDNHVVSFAQRLPLHYKILRTDNAVVRKRILRNLAIKLGLPAKVVDARKRAAQFGSGAARLLTQLAASYWREREPRLSARESGSQARIQEFLETLREETVSARRPT